MNTPKIKVKTNELLAMCLLASHDESRFVLNSLLVEQSPTGTLLVATDGRRLGVLKVDSGPSDKTSLLIPRTLIERFALLKTVADVTLYEENGIVVIEGPGFRLYSEAIDLDYPNWRQALPKSNQPKDWAQLGVTAEYYDTWHEIAKFLGGSGYFHLRQANPLEPIEIILHVVSNFYGLLMPLEESGVKFPEWVKTL